VIRKQIYTNQTADKQAVALTIKSFSKNLFWDTNPVELDMEIHAKYIIERVLDYGNWNDWLLIYKYYGLERLKAFATEIKNLFPESLSFIATVTQTPEDQFRCYTQIHSNNPHWNF
jgi:hypothetical protein